MRVFWVVATLAVVAAPAWAKDMLFWNQTSKEFNGVYLAPAGTTQWGPNQTDNDNDHSVSADERLKITGVAAGSYDVKLVDTAGRTCVVPWVVVKGGGKVAFTVEEKQLARCTPK
jgi:hypothetical protein